MAKKVHAIADPDPDPENAEAAEDLDVLHPERRLVLAGREITVREYGFVEGLRLHGLAKPFADEISALLTAGDVLSYERMLDLIGDHHEVVMELVAISADVERAWLDTLGDADGNLLLMAWWGACGPFFLRSAVRRYQIERQEKAALERIVKDAAGAMSTPASSPTDTAPATDPDKSAAIPGDSFSSGTPLPSAGSASNAANG